MVPDARLQQIIASKDTEAALRSCTEHGYVESWAILDGSLVVYDADSPPVWLAPILAMRDEDGNTPPELASVTPMRRPYEGEYIEGVDPLYVPMEA